MKIRYFWVVVASTAACMALLTVAGVCPPLAIASPKGNENSQGQVTWDTDSGEANNSMESTLHCLAVYILAAEILGYLEDGAGDTTTLAAKYKDHPGWIPAFGKADYDEDDKTLFVPLGQCVWKIYTGKEERMEFCLLQPTDKGLQEDEKKILLNHLFFLANQADIARDSEIALRNTRLAAGLLYPIAGQSLRPSSESKNKSVKTQSDFDHCM